MITNLISEGKGIGDRMKEWKCLGGRPRILGRLSSTCANLEVLSTEAALGRRMSTEEVLRKLSKGGNGEGIEVQTHSAQAS